MVIIRITGKARQVFTYFSLLAKKQGHLTLGELAKRIEQS